MTPLFGRILVKQYLIDELRPNDYKKIKEYMDKTFQSQNHPIEGMYWVPLSPDLMDSVQVAHTGCQPFYFAVILEPTSIYFELLLRTRNRMRCDCIHYANERQRNSIIEFADSVFERLELKS
jgi:hypothetical protein